VSLVRGSDSVARYVFHPYDELRSMQRMGESARSAFGPDGIIAGSERAERFLFWPMGIASPGAMRQWAGMPPPSSAGGISTMPTCSSAASSSTWKGRDDDPEPARRDLNIHKGLSHFNRRMVIHELREGLRELDPDFVFLQEVQGLNQRYAMRFATGPTEPQHEFLAGGQWQHAYGPQRRLRPWPPRQRGAVALSFPLVRK